MSDIIIYLIVSILSMSMVFLDSKLFEKKTKKSTYIKILLLCNLITFICIKMTSFSVGTQSGVNIGTNKPTIFVPELNQSYIAGKADF